MTLIDPSTAAHAAASAPTRTALRAGALITAARALLPALEAGTTITSAMLREAMVAAFGGSDAEGHWLWKDAYDACEIAQLLFLRAFAPALRHARPDTRLSMLQRLAALLPTHTKRSAESQALQQLSTPLPIAHVAACAAALTEADTVLEPSAGTGLLAIHAELAGARLILNELSDHRAALLRRIFPDAPVSQHDAAHIHDHLAASLAPDRHPDESALLGRRPCRGARRRRRPAPYRLRARPPRARRPPGRHHRGQPVAGRSRIPRRFPRPAGQGRALSSPRRSTAGSTPNTARRSTRA